MDFSDIEPYRDEHVRDVLDGLIKDGPFLEVMQYVFPEKTVEEVDNILSGIQSIDEFQDKIAYWGMKKIIEGTVDEITIQGLENIDLKEQHLFISNHRDIILDSAFFNVLLHENKFKTTETAIGNNLLGHETVNALTKLNKNFTVSRNLIGRELYEASLKLSQYIRQSVTENKSSIWISQREGRAKDGDDKTQKGLLKMLGLAAEGDLEPSMKELNIRTLSISYEYDPCDIFKVKEILEREISENYTKQSGEDKKSIIAGITGRKGKVNFVIGKGHVFPIGVDSSEDVKADPLQKLASNIDNEIYSNYVLYPNNYVASDLLDGSNQYLNKKYTKQDRIDFENYLNETLAQMGFNPKSRNILLKKYAFPLINYLSIQECSNLVVD